MDVLAQAKQDVEMYGCCDIGTLMDEIERLTAERDRALDRVLMSVPDWIRAIDNEMVCSHLGVADAGDAYDTAKAKLHQLIQWHITVATDPTVNGGYVLVPVEPTLEMVEALNRRIATTNRGTLINPKQALTAALAAAPKSEEPK